MKRCGFFLGLIALATSFPIQVRARSAPSVELIIMNKPFYELVKQAPEARPHKESDAHKISQLIDRLMKDPGGSQQKPSGGLAAAAMEQVRDCWTLDHGVKGLEGMQVRVEVYLNQDGNIRGVPEFNTSDKQRMDAPGEGPYRAFAENARRAVSLCAPYDLPKDQYDKWQHIEFNFDPQEMMN